MPEIGVMLREARMRAGIDVSDLEEATKIRAKYLRALENEEWNLLPGSTYVKSFLRTYAEALGLDAKLLVEEYKLRHERLSEMEMQPIIASTGRPRRRTPRPASPRWLILGLAGAGLLLVILLLIGISAGPGSRSTGPRHALRTPTASVHPAAVAHPRVHTVSLEIIPTGAVYVCLTSSAKTPLINAILGPGSPPRHYRARRFSLSVGNSSVRLLIDGRPLAVPVLGRAVAFSITARSHTQLPAGSGPVCA